MTQQTTNKTEADWSAFISKHKAAFAVFMAAAIIAAVGAVYVFVWFTGNAQATDLVPSALNFWSIGHFVTFILHAILWELVLVGIPVAISAVIGWQWYKRLPDKDRYNLSQKGSKSSRAGGAVGPLLFLAFAMKVYVDGNWNVAIASWTVDYVIGSMVIILIWIAVIFAIPAIIGLAWWIHRENK